MGKALSKKLRRKEIKRVVPFTEPFLFLDEIIKVRTHYIIAAKEITEENCQGHFGVFPGHLLCEILAQAAAFLVLYWSKPKSNNALALAKTTARFLNPVYPGEKVIAKVDLERKKKQVYFFKGEAFLKRNVRVKVLEWQGIGIGTRL